MNDRKKITIAFVSIIIFLVISCNDKVVDESKWCPTYFRNEICILGIEENSIDEIIEPYRDEYVNYKSIDNITRYKIIQTRKKGILDEFLTNPGSERDAVCFMCDFDPSYLSYTIESQLDSTKFLRFSLTHNKDVNGQENRTFNSVIITNSSTRSVEISENCEGYDLRKDVKWALSIKENIIFQ